MLTNILRCSRHFLLLLCITLPLSGCGAVLVGGAAAGTVAYIQGDLNAVLDGNVTKSTQAVDTAIKKTGVKQISRNTDSFSAHYILRTSQDEKVEIILTKATRQTTEIVIRVGFFGDEALSHHILDEIKSAM